MYQAFAVVGMLTTAAVLGGWLYFRRCRPNLPPVGVCDFSDVAIMLGGIVMIPYLYLALPEWTVATLLGVSFLSTLHLTMQPILGGRSSLLVAVGLVATDIVLALTHGFESRPFSAVNGLVMVIAVVGATNIWAQTGMKARDVALLAAGLTIYDAVAVWHLTVMDDLFVRLSHLPLVPAVAWPGGMRSSPSAWVTCSWRRCFRWCCGRPTGDGRASSPGPRHSWRSSGCWHSWPRAPSRRPCPQWSCSAHSWWPSTATGAGRSSRRPRDNVEPNARPGSTSQPSLPASCNIRVKGGERHAQGEPALPALHALLPHHGGLCPPGLRALSRSGGTGEIHMPVPPCHRGGAGSSWNN